MRGPRGAPRVPKERLLTEHLWEACRVVSSTNSDLQGVLQELLQTEAKPRRLTASGVTPQTGGRFRSWTPAKVAVGSGVINSEATGGVLNFAWLDFAFPGTFRGRLLSCELLYTFFTHCFSRIVELLAPKRSQRQPLSFLVLVIQLKRGCSALVSSVWAGEACRSRCRVCSIFHPDHRLRGPLGFVPYYAPVPDRL